MSENGRGRFQYQSDSASYWVIGFCAQKGSVWAENVRTFTKTEQRPGKIPKCISDDWLQKGVGQKAIPHQ